MKTTFNDTRKPGCEKRPYTSLGVIPGVGKSRARLVCSFCSATVTAYLWSLAGSGKRCSCGALFSRNGDAFKLPDKVSAEVV